MATVIDPQGQPVAVAAPRRRSSMDWFYRILDVEYGVELAVRDSQRVTTSQGAGLSFIINALLFVAFLGVWFRYDLWSTVNVFAPVRDNIVSAIPQDNQAWQLVRSIGSYTLGIAAAFFTTLIQWAYPRLAQRHDAALWGLAAAAVFDIATDYRDVQKDFPVYAEGLLQQLASQDSQRWLIAGLVCAALGLFFGSYRSLLWLLAGICFACLLWPVRSVWVWGIVFIGTIFSSFVAQSLVIIHAAKCLALLRVARGMAREV